MLQVLIRFLTFNVISEHPAVYWGLALVWVVLLFAALSSVRSLSIPAGAKAGWFALILLLPLAGLGLYALRCLVRADWSFFKPFFVPPKSHQKIAPR